MVVNASVVLQFEHPGKIFCEIASGEHSPVPRVIIDMYFAKCLCTKTLDVLFLCAAGCLSLFADPIYQVFLYCQVLINALHNWNGGNKMIFARHCHFAEAA